MQSIMYMLLPITIANAIGYKKEEEVPPTPPPEEVWYEVTIDNSANSNNLTEYQILLEINNDEQFFNDFNNDQIKIEVYDEDKSTLIPFYIEEWDTTNKNAKIWIKVPLIPANSIKKIYLKYNPDRTESLSNPDNTFDLYDDFEDGVIDTEKWVQIAGTIEENDGYLSVGGNSSRIRTVQQFNDIVIRFRAKMTATAQYDHVYCGYRCDENFVWEVGNNKGNGYLLVIHSNYYTNDIGLTKLVNGSGTSLGDGTTNLDTTLWQIYEIRVFQDKHKAYENDSLEVEVVDDSFSNGFIYFGRRHGGEIHVDWIIVRKYTEPEPTVTYNKL